MITKLQSMRLGFATNSSSSHSVVVAQQRRTKQQVLREYDGTHGEVNFPYDGYDTWDDLNSVVNYGIEVILKQHSFFRSLLEASKKQQGWYERLDWDSFGSLVLNSSLTAETQLLVQQSGPFIWERGFSGHIPYVQSGYSWDSGHEIEPWVKEYEKTVEFYKLEEKGLKELEDMFWFFVCNTAEVEASHD